MSDFLPDDPRRVRRKTMVWGVILVLAVVVVAWSAWKIHWHGAPAAEMNKPPRAAAAPPSR